MVAAVDSDADNVFVTLSARQLNPALFIVSRAMEEETREKLIKAGANRVVMPVEIGGKRMAAMLMKPVVCEFLDVVTKGAEIEYRLEEIKVSNKSSLLGISIAETDIRAKTGALIIAIRHADDRVVTNPPPNTKIEKGDLLIVFGTIKQLRDFSQMAG